MSISFTGHSTGSTLYVASSVMSLESESEFDWCADLPLVRSLLVPPSQHPGNLLSRLSNTFTAVLEQSYKQLANDLERFAAKEQRRPKHLGAAVHLAAGGLMSLLWCNNVGHAQTGTLVADPSGVPRLPTQGELLSRVTVSPRKEESD